MYRVELILLIILTAFGAITAEAAPGLVPAIGVSGTAELGLLGTDFASFGVGSFFLLSPDGSPAWSFDYTLAVFRESLLDTSIRFGSLTARTYAAGDWGALTFGLRLVGVPYWEGWVVETAWLGGLELGVGVSLSERLWVHFGGSYLFWLPLPFAAGGSLRLSVIYLVPMVSRVNTGQDSEQPVVQNPEGS